MCKICLILPFQSSLPTRGSDGAYWDLATDDNAISILAPHEGERPFSFHGFALLLRFQSSLPTRGSDIIIGICCYKTKYFNPRSPRGGATRLLMLSRYVRSISILAPHEGERLLRLLNRARELLISILAPHEGERQFYPAQFFAQKSFQSSLPTRESDDANNALPKVVENFNPRSPRGGATRITVCCA